MSSNPYEPPSGTASSPSTEGQLPTEFRRGPAWHIVFTALAGGFASIPFLARQSAIGLLLVVAGSVFGGIIFRVRSRHWQHDPTVRYRQIIYSLLSISSPPAALFLLAGSNGQGPGIVLIGAIVGV